MQHSWFTGRHVVLIALVLIFTGPPASAQQNATLTGVVVDSSAVVIPDVAVLLTNSDTGETYTTSTNETGAYTIPFIKPGNYEITVEKAGFKKYSRPGVRLDTAASTRADIGLELGEVTEVITVVADVPLLKTENSSVGSVVQNKTIVNMPLLGRRAAQLVRLSGFVVQKGTDSQFQIAGGRSNNAMWTLDGGSTQNILLGVASLNFDPPIEALEEMNVEVSNYKAEMGRSGGGFIQMTTKAGTNAFHGAIYNFLRNDAMDSRSFFAARKQKLRRNQYGWAFGGPIAKDRTFFFASQEWIKNNTADPIINTIPDQAEVNGDFSGRGTTIMNPFTGNPVPNNIIPLSEQDPVGRAIAGLWPAPNVPNQASGRNNFQALDNRATPSQTLSVRIDHTVNDRNRVYGRYVHDVNGGNQTQGLGIFPHDVHPNARIIQQQYYNASITGITNFTNLLVGEYRYTYNWRQFHPRIPHVARGEDLSTQLGITGINPDFFPDINLTGGITGFGRGGQERRQFPVIDNHFVTNWTYVKGNHTIKWGGEMRASQNDDINLPRAGGEFTFNNNATNDSVAALLYGFVNRGRRTETFLIRSRANSMGMYVQDDWKVSPKLTLNLGLRYDLDTPRWEKIDNRQNSFDEFAINPVCDCRGTITWSGRDARGGSKYAHNFVKGNIGPRLGFAHRPAEGWVVRGGASVLYIGQYDQATPFVANAGFAIDGDFRAANNSQAAFRLQDGLPEIIVPTEADLLPGFGSVPVGSGTIFSPRFFQPENRPNPYLITYNFNIQRSLAWNSIFEIAYLTTLGRKLTIPGTATVNQIHPNAIQWVRQGVNQQTLRPFGQFGDVRMLSPTWGSSEYHGLNLKFEKRYSAGLHFSMNYTWAKAMDDVEGRDELAGEGGNFPFTNQYDRSIAWSLGGSHIAHRYITSVVYDLPWGQGRAHSFSSGVANQVLGGWTIGTIIEARTGPPFSTWWGNAGQVYPTAARVRADANAPYQESTAWRDNVRGGRFFNTDAFARPADLTFGNVGRNAFIGPGALRTDLSLIKKFFMPWEGHSLEFRAEMINFPNRANFDIPNGNRQAGNFGTVTGLTTGASGRIVQLGLRYGF